MQNIKSNKSSRNRIVAIVIIVVFLLILVGIYMINNKNTINNIFGEEIQKEEVGPLFSYIVYDNQDEQNIKVLATINSENGIEYIQNPNGTKIYGNGKNKITIDYLVKKDEEKIIIIKESGKEEQEEKILVDDEVIGNIVKIEKLYDIEGCKVVSITNNMEFTGYKIYYKIGKNSSWIEGEGKLPILDYDLTTNNLINEDETITIAAKIQNTSTSNIVYFSKDYAVDTTSTVSSFKADSLIQAMERYDFGTGNFKVSVSNEIYNLRVYSFEEDFTITVNTTFGTEEDVATENTYAQNMVVIKVNGNLTINSGKTLTSYASSSGYGGPKGMMIYCTGTITNNGTISMTARGAKAEGQNVYLWKNANESYEYVPATGATGGAAIVARQYYPVAYDAKNGNIGNNGNNRATAGGGGGGALSRSSSYGGYATSGAGGAGTSYSGGCRRRWGCCRKLWKC